MKLAIACVAALATGLVATKSNASILYVDLRGVVSSGFDNANIFGLGTSANLGGQKFEAVFRLDTSSYYSGCPAVSSCWSEEYDSNHVTAQIFINNTEYYYGLYSGLIAPGAFMESDNELYSGDFSAIWAYGGFFGDWRTADTASAQSAFLTGMFDIKHDVYDEGYPTSAVDASGQLEFLTITVNDMPPSIRTDFGIPEPSTWLLLTAGFGAIGFALRRKRIADRICIAGSTHQPNCV